MIDEHTLTLTFLRFEMKLNSYVENMDIDFSGSKERMNFEHDVLEFQNSNRLKTGKAGKFYEIFMSLL